MISLKPAILKHITLILLFHIILPYSANSQLTGKLTNVTFYSESLNQNRNIDIYTPYGYDQDDTTEKYPLIIFLHGAGVNQTAYRNIKSLLDYEILVQSIDKMIFVLPDGSAEPYAGSFYTNSELYGNFEDYIVHDLVKYINDNYNTINSSDKRAIMGHSMGGYGSMKIALKHSEIFSAVVSHSGPLNLDLTETYLDEVLYENGSQPPYIFNPDPSNKMTYYMYTLAGAFSPDISSPPHYVRLPLNSAGEVIPEIITMWRPHNTAELARNYEQSNNLSIFFDCGTNDELNLYKHNTSFSDTLLKYQIPHRFNSHWGGHTNSLIIQLAKSLDFIDDAFNNTLGINDIQYQTSINNILIYPVPAIDILNLKFKLNRNQNIKIQLFNSQGVKLIHSGDYYCNQGKNEIIIETNNLPTGLYFINISGYLINESRIIEIIK